MKQVFTVTCLSLLSLVFTGCGGGGNTNTSGSGNNATNIQGKWQVIAVSPQGSFTGSTAWLDAIVEANLQQSGTTVSAASQDVAVVPFNVNYANGSGELEAPYNACNGTTSITGSLSGSTFSFTLTESGSLGNLVISGSALVTPDGKTMSGNYSHQAGCGLPATSGTITGTLVPSFNGNYAGTIDGVSTTASAAEGSQETLTVTATSSNGTFSLAGKAVGGGFQVSGNVAGSSYTYQGIYMTTTLTNLLKYAGGGCDNFHYNCPSGAFLVYNATTGQWGSLSPS
jgi:hypothetical protein